MQEWNFLKDVGIAAATLIIFGRIMYELVQALSEYYKATREDNKERNQQFETLLRINESIANQMELTRKAIEVSTDVSERQDEAIRQSSAEVSTLQHDVLAGFQAVQTSWITHLHPMTQSLESIIYEMKDLNNQVQASSTNIETHLSDAGQDLLLDIQTKLGESQTVFIKTMAATLLPVLEKLDALKSEVMLLGEELLKQKVSNTQDDLNSLPKN
jgi:hypothetical protein